MSLLFTVMSQQRMALWAAEEIDEDLQDVDLTLAIGNYGQNGMYDDGALLYLIFFCAIP